ncbi:hypothetical protein [Flavobacterium sp. LC2016-01]|uniref:hypothetical protein n=1 Tax=Flavobacterium sp. LC2016-01 TaxID=2675876 RepID=UPI0012BAB714|nr:hypothetical protein [Flavobacterium sp. LC2016-01]MTH14477.1 hypothetical protein [Flavobacterium sp. LC2016-01]
MTIADLIKEFIETSKERLKSPFSGAFLWSFGIYNWRPFFLLMFSDASMEDKIVVINHEYCKPGAILWPIGLALFYIVILPFIMWLIDWPVVFAKKIRLAKVYENKNNVIIEKIAIAAKISELKNAESGNKELQNLLDENTSLKEQTFSLQESINQINELNKNRIDGLNDQLKIAIETSNEKQKEINKMNKLVDSDFNQMRSRWHRRFNRKIQRLEQDYPTLSPELVKEIYSVSHLLNYYEFEILIKIETSNTGSILNGLDENLETLKGLQGKGLLRTQYNGSKIEFFLTDVGKIVTEVIQDTRDEESENIS